MPKKGSRRGKAMLAVREPRFSGIALAGLLARGRKGDLICVSEGSEPNLEGDWELSPLPQSEERFSFEVLSCGNC